VAAMNKDLVARIQFGDLVVTLTAGGASWNPDVAHDLISRVNQLWKESISTMLESGVFNNDDEDSDDE